MRLKSIVAIISSACLSISANTLHADWLKQSRDIMGTLISVEIEHEDNAVAHHCAEQVFSDMRRIDALMSPYKDSSEISRINRLAYQQAVALDDELYLLIKKSIHFSILSHGAFDITYASVGHYYDYRRHIQPDEATLKSSLPSVNYKNLRLQDHHIRFAAPGMRIDLGGIAKGYAVDRAIELLRHCGISRALVSAGGDSRILGDHDGRPWMIGIRHPRKENALALSIPLSDSAFSTSGDYERYFLTNNERIHHIINPTTGRSARASWSASVIGNDATTTDALSTTLFILGAERGIQLIDTLPELDAIIIDSDGVVHYSSGLMDPANPG